jgi:hypothetical protein
MDNKTMTLNVYGVGEVTVNLNPETKSDNQNSAELIISNQYESENRTYYFLTKESLNQLSALIKDYAGDY